MKMDITKIEHLKLDNPQLNVVLYQPEIPANTGNIGRLCGAARLTLHLIHPLGFRVDDSNLKRAGLDYWHEIDVRHHSDFQDIMDMLGQGASLYAFSSHSAIPYTKATVSKGDYLLFGRESMGLPEAIKKTYPCYSVPIWGNVRSLNLASTVGIVSYHFLHKMGRF